MKHFRRTNALPLALAALVLGWMAPAAAAQVYGYSDGSADGGFGLPTGGDVAWFQCFDTASLGLSQDDILVVSTTNGADGGFLGADPGSSGGVAVYQDPSGDCDPRDLTGSDLVATATWTAQHKNAGIMEEIPLCPGGLVSGKFWVCAWLDHDPGELPAPIDTSQQSNGRTWVTGHPLGFDPYNPNDPSNVVFQEMPTHVWVIQANRYPRVQFVDRDATGQNNGTSWQDAFNDLQDALCVAIDGDEIWVAEGTYLPDHGAIQTLLDQGESFHLVQGVEIYGGFDGTESQLGERDVEQHLSILSGDLLGDDQPSFQNTWDNSHNVVKASNVDDSTVLDGFTITAGDNSWGGGGGAGMLVQSATPTLAQCVFLRNYAGVNGTLAIFDTMPAPIHIDRCRFEGNVKGLHVWESEVQVSWCSFQDNTSRDALVEGYSGAKTTFVSCEFIGGAADTCIFMRNSVALINSSIREYANAYGMSRAIFVDATLELINSTISENDHGLDVTIYGFADIDNSILWGNGNGSQGDQISLPATYHASVDHSCVQGWNGGLGGAGNIGDDPRFVNPAGGNLRLQSGSPCIDAGDQTALPPGILLDLAGNPRVYNDEVDMGAYEDQACSLGPQVYCTELQNQGSGGCFARITTSDPCQQPVAGANDYDIIVTEAESGKPAIIFYGFAPAQIPFANGTLCVQPPVRRTGVKSTGGSGGCTGQFALRCNEPSDPTGSAGQEVYFQGWLRDPGSGAGMDLSDAVKVTFQ